MCLIMTIYAGLLFFVLTPGVILTIPPKSKKMIIAGVHAVIFGIVFGLTHKFIHKLKHMM